VETREVGAIRDDEDCVVVEETGAVGLNRRPTPIWWSSFQCTRFGATRRAVLISTFP
jgi:hypothetical protein